MNDASILYIV